MGADEPLLLMICSPIVVELRQQYTQLYDAYLEKHVITAVTDTSGS